MLLSLFAPAFALSVPLRATWTEELVPGQSATASSALTASVGVTNPWTGVSFPVSSSELTVNGREASGSTALSFSANPANSLRTWAIYFVDAHGNLLGDPEVVDVLFDRHGNGGIAARDSAGWVDALAVSAGQLDGTVGVSVSGTGAKAAYIGITELTTDGSRLFTNPDLSVLDAVAYAAFQGLGLDAMAPLDTWRVQLEGTLSVSGLGVSTTGEVEEGRELEWELSFHDGRTITECEKGGSCTVTPATTGTATYARAVGDVKRKKAETPRVVLKPSDQVFDSWDAGFVFSVEGDVRGLELAASLDIPEARVASDIVSLDPNGLGVTARKDKDDDDDDTGLIVDIFIDTDCEDCGDYDFTVPNPSNPPPWVHIAQQDFEITVLDSGGHVVATHACLVRPTARTQAGTADPAVLVGDCTRNELGTDVSRLRVEVGPHGTSFWKVDMAGPAFTQTSTQTTCEKGGTCTTTSTSVAGGSIEISMDGTPFLNRAIHITDTTYGLPFAFSDDVDGADAALAIELLDPTRTLEWSSSDGVLYGKSAGVTVYTLDLEELEVTPTGLYTTNRDIALDAAVVGRAVELTSRRDVRLHR